jgi:hypothetical protein
MIENCRVDDCQKRRLIAQRDALVKALEDIKRATIEGRVCDDVAWFDQITTLHDFCEIAIDQAISDWAGWKT